jgi:SAM-dependent methyltransferase
MSKEHESNRVAWNEAAESYRAGLDSSIELLKSGGTTFCEPELRHLKALVEVPKRCIHLQCAGDTDTLSLINFGAREVVGVDISEEMIRIAQIKSDTLKMNARWVSSDVLNTPAELNGTADLVYTGKGAINWMMDIDAWASVVSRLLKPGGVLYLFEGHPFTYCFDMKATELKIDPIYQGYFSETPYASQDWPETYVCRRRNGVVQGFRQRSG